MKKLVIMVIMTLLMPLMALSESGIVDGIEWSYTISDDGIEIMRNPTYNYKLAGEVIIPSTFWGIPVTSIGDFAFESCMEIESITIPNTVTHIKDSAFSNCIKLNTVALPESLTHIGTGAFYGCVELIPGQIWIPNSVVSIASYAFEGCTKFGEWIVINNDCVLICNHFTPLHIPESDVVLPEGIRLIAGSAFANQFHITSVKIPSTVRYIGDGAFYYCENLESVNFPEGITSLGNQMFAFCPQLKTFTMPDGITEIGKQCFCMCTGLETVSIPSSVKSIGDEAFLQCSKLSVATIPNGVTNIGVSAFYNCNGLTSITIPSNEMEIGYGAFADCARLKEVHIADLSSWFNIKFRDFGANPLCSAHHLYVGDNEITDIIIPNDVTKIGQFAFEGFTALKTLTIHSNVQDIEKYAFYGCTGLSTVYVDAGETARIKSFLEKSNLDCSQIEFIEPLQEWIKESTGQVFEYTVRNGQARIIGVSPAISEVVIPTFVGTYPVTYIEDFALTNSDELVAISIPEGVTRVGRGAFSECAKLETVSLPTTLEFVGDGAFSGTPYGEAVNAKLFRLAEGVGSLSTVSVVSSNIVVHYVLNSRVADSVVPSYDTDLVVVSTEVKGDAVAVPQNWAEQFPEFVSMYGSDFGKALVQPSGKVGPNNAPMFVWQDYVAGTDPTDKNDLFTASITFDTATGEPIVSWSPEVKDANGSYLRKYTTWGKKSLTDTSWTEIPDGREAEYNFFKITVEMK